MFNVLYRYNRWKRFIVTCSLLVKTLKFWNGSDDSCNVSRTGAEYYLFSIA